MLTGFQEVLSLVVSSGITFFFFSHVLSRPKRFPKAIWTSLMKNYAHLRKEGKLHFVSFRRAKHAKLHVSYTGYTVDDEDASLHSHKVNKKKKKKKKRFSKMFLGTIKLVTLD